VLILLTDNCADNMWHIPTLYPFVLVDRSTLGVEVMSQGRLCLLSIHIKHE